MRVDSPTSGRGGLAGHDVLVMQQVTSWTSNDFAIRDARGGVVGRVHTRGSAASRFFRGDRQFEVWDPHQGRLLFRVEGLVALGRVRGQVSDEVGRVIARTLQRFTLFHQAMDVFVTDGTELKLRGDFLDDNVQIQAGGHPVATVSRQSSGLVQALMGHGMYVLRLDPAMPVIVRFAVIGSVIAVDLTRAQESWSGP